MKTQGISRHLGTLVVLLVMTITAPLTIGFAVRVFGWDTPYQMLRSTLLVACTEVALLVWHEMSKRLARGERQHSIAAAMVVVSVLGVVLMAAVELLLEFAAADMANASKAAYGTAGVVVLVVLFAANLASGIAFQHADPDLMERRAQERVTAKAASARLMVSDAVADEIHNRTTQRKEELIAPQVGAFMDALMTEQKLLAARTVAELRNMSAGGEVVDGTARPAPVAKPVPPKPEERAPQPPRQAFAKDADDTTAPQDGERPLV